MKLKNKNEKILNIQMPNKINFPGRLIDFDLVFNNFIPKRNKNITGINKETNTKKLIKLKGV